LIYGFLYFLLARPHFAFSHKGSPVLSFNADICFFSVRTLTNDGRLTDNALAENSVRRVMMSKSKKSVLMLDSQKIGEACMNTLCTLDDISYVVSETDISLKFPKHIKKFV
jgi:DeoR/GlpR family transcriptional regulator of sugar metabolism